MIARHSQDDPAFRAGTRRQESQQIGEVELTGQPHFTIVR